MHFFVALAFYVGLIGCSISPALLEMFEFSNDALYSNSTGHETCQNVGPIFSIERCLLFLPTFVILNWIASIPAVLSVFALRPVPTYFSIVTFALSNYMAILVFLSGSLNCASLFQQYITFNYRYWFIVLAFSILLCVFGGLISGLTRNYQTCIHFKKSRKRRLKKMTSPYKTDNEHDFAIDIDNLESEMIMFMRLSSSTLSFPSRSVNPDYSVKLPILRFPENPKEVVSYSSANSEYDSSLDDPYYKRCLFELTEDCPICLEVYNAGDEITKLSCFHCFHVECIKAWIVGQGKQKCPVCRWPTFIEKKHFYSVLASQKSF